MTKHDHILYWKETAEEDWLAAQSLAAHSDRSASALVFAHWTLEKLSKALWVQQHNALPPTTDTVAIILADNSFALTPAQLQFTQHLEAAHDEVLEPNFEHPLQLQETPEELLQQANALREKLLHNLHLHLAAL